MVEWMRLYFFFSSRRRHTRLQGDWSSDVCSSDLVKNATDLADRADAVVALGKMKNDDEVVAVLGDILRNDKAWGVRATAPDTLGQLGATSASKRLPPALDSPDGPWARNPESRAPRA